jgi:hypothetical protein
LTTATHPFYSSITAFDYNPSLFQGDSDNVENLHPAPVADGQLPLDGVSSKNMANDRKVLGVLWSAMNGDHQQHFLVFG